MKTLLLAIVLITTSSSLSAQKIDSIYVNLYTDSLKVGTYNYINVDGLLHDGSYRPLDSTYIHFSSDNGEFKGNSLFLPLDFKEEKVRIKLYLRSNINLCKDFVIWVKKTPDPELKSNEELLKEMKEKKKKNKNG